MSARAEVWPPADVPVLDRRALDAVREVQDAGAPDLVAETAALFFQETPARITALKAASVTADARALRNASHSIKGSCWLLGLARLARACESLEADGAEGRLDDAPLWVSRIAAEYPIAAEALRRAVEVNASDPSPGGPRLP